MGIERAKILIVDDEPDIVNSLKHFLSIRNFNVIEAFNGEQALRILDTEETDLILLDIMMNGANEGIEIARTVKEKYPNVKIIVVTGYYNEADPLLKEHILDDLIKKPIRLGDLFNKLKGVLREKGMSNLDFKESLKGTVISIKAKLLFAEPSLEIYNFLRGYFKGLSYRGENYETDTVSDIGQIAEKLNSFKPDIIAVNGLSFKKHSLEAVLSEINFGNKTCLPEVIGYNIGNIGIEQSFELENLMKSLASVCLKNGLLEIKWVEV